MSKVLAVDTGGAMDGGILGTLVPLLQYFNMAFNQNIAAECLSFYGHSGPFF